MKMVSNMLLGDAVAAHPKALGHCPILGIYRGEGSVSGAPLCWHHSSDNWKVLRDLSTGIFKGGTLESGDPLERLFREGQKSILVSP